VECELPAAGVAQLLRVSPGDFVVAYDGAGQLAAVAGLEVCETEALLRSVAVRATHRGQGLASDLVERLVADAERRGLRSLYLLTTTAEGFFPRHGFQRIEREVAPPSIAATEEFTSACPASATVMVRHLSAYARES
jgi:amino-acid N-acetyltransferase